MSSNPTPRDQPMPAILHALAALKVHLDEAPPDWHASLHRAIGAGCFMKLESALLAGGHTDARLMLCRSDVNQASVIWTRESS